MRRISPVLHDNDIMNLNPANTGAKHTSPNINWAKILEKKKLYDIEEIGHTVEREDNKAFYQEWRVSGMVINEIKVF